MGRKSLVVAAQNLPFDEIAVWEGRTQVVGRGAGQILIFASVVKGSASAACDLARSKF